MPALWQSDLHRSAQQHGTLWLVWDERPGRRWCSRQYTRRWRCVRERGNKQFLRIINRGSIMTKILQNFPETIQIRALVILLYHFICKLHSECVKTVRTRV